MRKTILPFLVSALVLSSGCSGISRVKYSRFDRGRKVVRVAVIAQDQSKADRYKMWAWTKKRPRIVPRDTYADEIAQSLAAQTGFHILNPEMVRKALVQLGLKGKSILTRNEIQEFRGLTGADVILFADVSFYLQNYLFLNTFGLVEVSMRMVGTRDGDLLWDAKGQNFALLISTDSALRKLTNKLVAGAARKLEQDKPMTI